MPTARRSTRSTRRTASDTKAPATRGERSDVFSGSSAREESDRVVAESKKRQEEAGKMPFRFYMNEGDEKAYIILDDEPKFLRWEHEEWDARNRKMRYHGCISATDNCPACESLEYRSYFAMYLTIIDLTPFKTKAGVEVEFSKKLLVVKQNQHKLFWRKFDKAGSLRGMLFGAFRDKKTDARIGGTIELEETLTEAELQDYIREYEDRDGKSHTEGVEPYDYLDLFPETTLEILESTFGTAPAAGSSRQATAELEDNYEDDKEDDGKMSRAGLGRDSSSRQPTRDKGDGDAPFDTSDSPNSRVTRRGRGNSGTDGEPSTPKDRTSARRRR